MKKHMKSKLLILSLIFVMVAIFPSFSNRLPDKGIVGINFTHSDEDLISIPASATLKPILEQYLNSEGSSEESNVIVEYNVQTGIEEEYTINYNEIQSDVTQLEAFEGNYYAYLQELYNQGDSVPNPFSSSDLLGPDDLTRVNDTTVFPFSAVVKIVAKLNETHVVWGSGAMIDSNHVLTAGHVVYDAMNGGWREDVTIIPGKNGTGTSLMEEPFGRAYATIMRSTAGWTQLSQQQHDWAVVTLDRDIGDETGWLGLIDLPYTHNNYSDRVYTAGYPATVKSGYYMYNISGIGGSATQYEHAYPFYGEGGQSGSSVWTYQNSEPYVLSIYAYGPEGGGIGTGTRITTEKFDLMNLWLAQDASAEPHVDLEVAGSNNILVDLDYSNVVTILLSRIPIVTSVQNYGNIMVDKVTLAYYLSVDDNITTDDYQIGKTTIRNLEAFESRSIVYNARIPLSVPPGKYEIGWIIDPDNDIAELFEDNNVFLNGLQLNVFSTFLDQILTDPLWLSLLIAGVALIIIIPTVIALIRRSKRKKLAIA
jgi:glutamyl endopeptidase